jgi:hypothetical protein
LKDGTRRWKSELSRHGDNVVGLIPEGLKARVLGEPEGEIDPGVRLVLDKLLATNPFEPEINPYILLRKRMGK